MQDFSKAVISTVPSRFGPINLIFTSQPTLIVLAAGFGSAKQLSERLLTSRGSISLTREPAPKELLEVFQRWSDGEVNAFSRVKVDQIGSKFRQECWTAMQQIPAGKTLSYAQLASKTSSPAAVRAAATSCASNLIAPLIPCHRIIRTDGTLGNYGYGAKLKLKLLQFEGVNL